MNNIKIALVEDDKLVANLLKDYLDSIDGFSVISVSYSGNSFLDTLDTENLPDIVLTDLRMKDGTGKDVVDELTKQHIGIKTIVISSHYQPNYIGYMFKSGANAFIPKEIDKKELVKVIRNVNANGHHLDIEQMETMRKQIASNTPVIPTNNIAELTPREIDVLKLLCYQLTAKEIGEKLFVSRKTVETHKSNLLSKTGAKNIAGLIIFAAQNKIIELDKIILT
ncbi:response regulator transcription factor [Aquimarina spongiae]|uniref:Two component transcriptional regulator, LuxR family n=1 Tax=Aquimarina spongiae TaxID=570521 RepID=A0A1M6KUP8_9FLAO|nr:response regulator transcription factor [Aquimarina spongiae]SHJ62622.1 two component transcriptional regulator, LuxR family [Aquimarina spongiae]